MSNITGVFSAYFELIDSYFGSIKQYLGEDEKSHIELGRQMANYPMVSDLILDAIGDLEHDIDGFWRLNAKAIIDFARNHEALKCLYSGDITPVVLENFVKRSALYIDTVILPDPIYNITIFKQQADIDRKYYLAKLIRHVFNVWKLRKLATASETNPPIIILPINLGVLKEENRKALIQAANKSCSAYLSRLFNEKIDDVETWFKFLNLYKTTAELVAKIKNIDLLPLRLRNATDIGNFLSKLQGAWGNRPLFKDNSIGGLFGRYIDSQFIRVQEHKYFCSQLNTEPIYDYELPWFFYNTEVGGVGLDAAIANVLQKERFSWLGNVPLEALPSLRQEGCLDYMRDILRHGITDLKAKSDVELIKVGEAVQKNFEEAYIRQTEETSSLEKKVAEITKKEIPITVTGFIGGFVPYLNNVISFFTAGRDIKKNIEELNKANADLKKRNNSSINILIKAYEK